jgi:hypothetical protein
VGAGADKDVAGGILCQGAHLYKRLRNSAANHTLPDHLAVSADAMHAPLAARLSGNQQRAGGAESDRSQRIGAGWRINSQRPLQRTAGVSLDHLH